MSAIENDLRLGIAALQLGLVSQPDLVSTIAAWRSGAKEKSLADVLLERQVIDEQSCRAIEELDRLQPANKTTAVETIVHIPGGEALLRALRQLNDVDLNETLGPGDDFSTRGPTSTETVADEFRPAAERFHVLHMHAQGGLGQVWMAEDTDLKRQVALKEIRTEHADHADSRSRFVQEAEITGRLEHPGIVPVYALGQHGDGRPYYVMRFIRGDSLQDAIKRYHDVRLGESDDKDAPTLRQLLARFVDVCEAVAYAHSRGVLHRDLKPDNVMLGLYGETLVVDWGLAKADGAVTASEIPADSEESAVKITSGTPTQLGSALGTLGYMSPEQARGAGDRLTPATDIYSLGATLFCILTGRAPIKDSDVGQVLEDTRWGKFPSPRSLVAGIPRALESICLQAMALEPAERYATAKELAADVGRYLDDEPVGAHRDTMLDRTSRWVRRHKSGVVAGAAALALVAVAASVSTVMIAQSRNHALQLADDNAKLAVAERESRDRAQRRQKEAEAATEQARQQQARAEKYYELAISTVDRFLTNVADDDRLKSVGLENLRRDLLVQARDFYELVIEQADEGDDPLHAERANSHQRLAEINFEVGEYNEAIEAYRKAAEQLLAMGDEHADGATYALLINDTALTLDAAGQTESAIEYWRGLVDAIDELIEAEPENAQYRGLLATVKLNLALKLTSRAPGESISLSAEAKQAAGDALELVPDDPHYRDTSALVHNNLGNTLIAQERYEEAGLELETAEAIWHELAGAAEGWLADQYAGQLALLHLNQAVVAAQSGQNDKATEYLHQGLAIRSRIAEQHPDVVQLQTRLADLRRSAAAHYRALIRYEDSVQQAGAALQIYQRLHDEHPGVSAYRQNMALTLLELGTTQLAMGAMDDAIGSMQQAIEVSNLLVDEDPERVEYRRPRALSRYYLAMVFIDAAEVEQAASYMRQASEEMAKLVEGRDDDLELIAYLCDSQTTLGSIYGPAALDDRQESQKWWQAARTTSDRLLSEKFESRLPPSLHQTVLKHRAQALTGLEQYDGALAAWDAAFAAAEGNVDYEMSFGKALTYFWAGRYGEALELSKQAALAQEHPSLVYAAARELSLGVQVIANGELPVEERSKWVQEYGATAVQLLQRVAEMGYFADTETIGFLDDDDYLEPVRDREDYQAFLGKLKQ